jgi:hypothetical protein
VLDAEKLKESHKSENTDDMVTEYENILKEVIKKYPGNLNVKGTRFEEKDT